MPSYKGLAFADPFSLILGKKIVAEAPPPPVDLMREFEKGDHKIATPVALPVAESVPQSIAPPPAIGVLDPTVWRSCHMSGPPEIGWWNCSADFDERIFRFYHGQGRWSWGLSAERPEQEREDYKKKISNRSLKGLSWKAIRAPWENVT